MNAPAHPADQTLGTTILSDAAPRTLARAFIEDQFTPINGGDMLLRHWRGTFYAFRDGAYTAVIKEELRAKLAAFLESVQVTTDNGPAIYTVTKRRVDDVLDALGTIVQVNVAAMPAWLDKGGRPKPENVIAFRNGLLDVAKFLRDPSAVLLPPTPMWFSSNVLPFKFDRQAPEPKRWWDFLLELWGDDSDSVQLLREWFGYTMTPDTSQQKILLLVGPTRSGKGTIARLLRALIGDANCCGPTLSGIASNFGMWGLIGKQLAILSDARMSGRADQAAVVERLLTISGEDAITIDRKNLEPVTLKLPTRLMVISNELPRLADASGALADRFIVLTLKESFLGREDTTLTETLQAELPGIALWALRGLETLNLTGRFTVPDASVEAVEELHDLTSPIKAFIRDVCEVGAGHASAAKDFYDAWRLWCRDQGRDQPGTSATLGRDLRAAIPGIKRTQPRDGINRVPTYEGIGVREGMKFRVTQERSKTAVGTGWH